MSDLRVYDTDAGDRSPCTRIGGAERRTGGGRRFCAAERFVASFDRPLQRRAARAHAVRSTAADRNRMGPIPHRRARCATGRPPADDFQQSQRSPCNRRRARFALRRTCRRGRVRRRFGDRNRAPRQNRSTSERVAQSAAGRLRRSGFWPAQPPSKPPRPGQFLLVPAANRIACRLRPRTCRG